MRKTSLGTLARSIVVGLLLLWVIVGLVAVYAGAGQPPPQKSILTTEDRLAIREAQKIGSDLFIQRQDLIINIQDLDRKLKEAEAALMVTAERIGKSRGCQVDLKAVACIPAPVPSPHTPTPVAGPEAKAGKE